MSKLKSLTQMVQMVRCDAMSRKRKPCKNFAGCHIYHGPTLNLCNSHFSQLNDSEITTINGDRIGWDDIAHDLWLIDAESQKDGVAA